MIYLSFSLTMDVVPLSFKEYLLFNHLATDISLEDKFRQYLKYGCLPTVTTLPPEDATINEFLRGVFNTVIVKDIIARSKSNDVELLEKLVRYVIRSTGNIISPNKISGFLSSQEKGRSIKSSTIAFYLDTLEKAYIVYQAMRFDIKGKLSMDKTYITDHEGILFQNIIDFLLSEDR